MRFAPCRVDPVRNALVIWRGAARPSPSACLPCRRVRPGCGRGWAGAGLVRRKGYEKLPAGGHAAVVSLRSPSGGAVAVDATGLCWRHCGWGGGSRCWRHRGARVAAPVAVGTAHGRCAQQVGCHGVLAATLAAAEPRGLQRWPVTAGRRARPAAKQRTRPKCRWQGVRRAGMPGTGRRARAFDDGVCVLWPCARMTPRVRLRRGA